MRLYRLLSRHGQGKARLWPWFEPPAPEAPKKYVGWKWDPAIKEWVQTDIDKMEIVVNVPKYPRPTEPPKKALPDHVPGWFWNPVEGKWVEFPLLPEEIAQGLRKQRKPNYVPQAATPTEVEGWSWSESEQEWVATIVMGEPVGFTPPRTLPPGITQEAVLEEFSYEWLYKQDYDAFIAQGYTVEATKRILRENYEQLLRMLFAQEAERNKTLWAVTLEHFGKDPVFVKETITVYGSAIVLAAVIGAVAGMILEHFTFIDEPSLMLPEPPGTYLMGPEDWFYSRNIGVSPMGNLYFSKCEGIGTEYTRHKRFGRGRLEDIIDFPGGFVEKGYDFPHWVKFRWSEWHIVYVGMLYSSSEMVYALKKEKISLAERAIAVKVRPPEEWCTGFHWYL